MDEQKNPQETPREPLKENEHIEQRAILNVKIGVRPGFVLRKVGEAYMVMPTGARMKENHGMITLNETGAVLFKASQQPNPTVRSLMDALKAEYGVEDSEAEEATRSFVQQAARAGLFEVARTVVDVIVTDEAPHAE